MRLTRLKLTGFKSFVDATDLLIEPGLTGVVGPNGCGKSNLVEALRWVMGESSYKSLRGTAMDDVIFSGSGSRPSRNIAEVVLTVDNTDRTAPAIFNDFEQLEISRRIERENGSTYRVNGKEVRARDVALLFADASTGARSSALVRQGQIGELISAKPQARRRVIEDAAGISGLHSRRHEAELRLRAAETNLERLDDVMGQITSQLDNLKRQARHAAKFKALSADIRRLEAQAAYLQFVAARSEVEATEKERDELVRLVAERTTALSTANKDNAVAASQLPSLRDAEAEAAARLVALIAARDGLDAQRQQIEARTRELAATIEQITEDIRREQALDKETTPIIERLDAEAEKLNAQNENSSEALETAENQKREAHQALTEAEAVLSDRLNAAAERRAEEAQIARAIEEADKRLASLKAQQASSAKEIEAHKNTSEMADRVAQLANKAEALRRTLHDAEGQLSDRETATKEARARLSGARDAVKDAEKSLAALNAEASALERMLVHDSGHTSSALIDEITASPGYETALGAVLGDDLTHTTDDSAPMFWTDPGNGVDDPSLPQGATPLFDVVQAPALLTRCLKQIGVVEDAPTDGIRSELKPGQTLVSRDGALWRWDGLTVRADAPTQAAQRLAQRNRLTELRGAVAAASPDLQRMRDDAETAKRAETEAETSFSDLRRHLSETRSALQKSEQVHRDAERELERIESRQSALKEAVAQLDNRIAEAETERADAEARKSNSAASGDFEEALKTARDTVDGARSALTTAQAKADGLDREKKLRLDRLRAVSEERAAWVRRAASASDQIRRLSDRRALAEEEREGLDGKPAEIEEKKRSLSSDLEKAETERKKAADRLAEMETQQRDSDKIERAAQSSLSEARERLASTEARALAAKAKLDEITSSIRANHEVAPNRLLSSQGVDEEKIPDLATVERDLERRKIDRERLGGVNLRAEEEAAEIEEQRDTMIAEREDLEQAIRRLRTAINNLNREGRERLLAAFDRVNTHFKRLFSTLFGGGTGELKLVESDDPLDAGLEIIARPPGKKPQTLTLLSGGEQALTATALIFAVFLSNPSPICVLDEVDAPLDDANVGRYCALLEDIVSQTDTRFLVITHNPITMARVDRLFGVTMAERGVSQLVSVDLATAETYRETA
ncbi:MAG: AAA family ATPase [Pseudomonadota bacterium]